MTLHRIQIRTFLLSTALLKPFLTQISLLSISFLFLLSVGTTGYAETREIQMSVAQNNLFSISPPESDAKGEWIINTYDRNLLNLVENGERLGKKYFVFKPLTVGKAMIYLEFIQNQRSVEKQVYKIEVKPSDGSTADASLPQDPNTLVKMDPNLITKTTNTQDEETLFAMIKKLYQRNLFDQALQYIATYESQYTPTDGAIPQYYTDVQYIKAEIILDANPRNTNDPKLRKQSLDRIKALVDQREQLLKQDEKNLFRLKNQTNPDPRELEFARQSIRLMVQLAQIQGTINQSSAARTNYVKILTLFPPELDAEIDKYLLKTRLALANTYYKEQKYEEAFQEFEEIIDPFIHLSQEEIFTNPIYLHARKELEETLYFIAHLYTIRSEYVDYNKAYDIYKMLSSDEFFPGGRYQLESKQKMNYLETNFLDYR